MILEFLFRHLYVGFIGADSYANRLFDLSRLPVKVMINKLYYIP